jgi:hypothetical protein
MRSNNCSFENKRCKKSELIFIANQPLSRIRQSATTKHKMRHTSTKAARILNSAPRLRFQLQIIVECVVPFTPSTDSQRSSVLINNTETRNAINNIIAPDEYQTFLWDPEWVCLGFLLQ